MFLGPLDGLDGDFEVALLDGLLDSLVVEDNPALGLGLEGFACLLDPRVD